MKQKRDWPEWFSHLSLPEEEVRQESQPSGENDGAVPEIANPRSGPAHGNDSGQAPDDSVVRK